MTYEEAVERSAPAWLRDVLEQQLGRDEMRALLGAAGRTHGSAIRLVAGSSLPPWVKEEERGCLLPAAYLPRHPGDLRRLPGYSEGTFVIQEEGAQAIAQLLGARSGERVLDACAGRGQKASLLVEQVGPSGQVWATDVYPEKLQALEREFERLRLSPPRTRAVDWMIGSADVPDDFDRVLVDAPCTGVGTLRRRPEIMQRLKPSDPARLADLQERILRRAATRARPGGRVVYAVCSVLREEGEALVERVRDVLTPAQFDVRIPGLVLDPAGSIRLLPGRHGTDGYFVQSFVRR
jgi:16S rRNA (cytosine967-C5)-methyltransferase